MVHVLLDTNESSNESMRMIYKPVVHIINVTVDTIKEVIMPDGLINVTGTMTVEPSEVIQSVDITLDGQALGIAVVNGTRYSGTVTLPGNISEGFHAIEVYVTLVTGEKDGNFTTINYDPDLVERTITITNRKPVAAFKMTKGNEESITRLEIEEDDEVAFDALSSEDPDQSDIIVSYVWDFGDGTNGTGLTPSHIYKKKGTWNVTLTVYDQEGEKDVISATVVVEEKGEDVPFGIELIIWVVIAMVLLMAAFMIIPGAMARISGASKVDIAKILEKKIDEKVEAMDEDKILEYKFGGKGAPEELQKEQIVPEPTPQVQVPVTPVVAPAPIFAASRFCTSCGATVEQGAKFCTECGTPY